MIQGWILSFRSVEGWAVHPFFASAARRGSTVERTAQTGAFCFHQQSAPMRGSEMNTTRGPGGL